MDALRTTLICENVIHTDVLVVGGGIAGTSAAIDAAHTAPNAKVLLACASNVFGGSSFTGTTWGLGMIAPKDDADAKRLAARILDIGCGAADKTLVESFVDGMRPAIERAQAWGMRFREPTTSSANEREYIACFDDAHRRWLGLERDVWRGMAQEQFEHAGIGALPHVELVDLVVEGGRVCGAVVFDAKDNRFVTVSCGAVVLACGGIASLWPQSLSAANQATAHALACRAGATATNLEFLQIMPTIVDPPCNVVFNEKMFRFMRARDVGIPHDLMELRAGYGPFSASFESRAVDYAIADAGAAGLALEPLPMRDVPEFVATYFAWLEKSCGLNAQSTVRIAHRAQASNGGIRIDKDGSTGVPGLFAAGEVAGGMHGANRLGGLASMAALVFGQLAGRAAAAHADASTNTQPVDHPWMHEEGDWETAEQALQQALDEHCMVRRTTEGLAAAATALRDAEAALTSSLRPTTDAARAARTRRTLLRLETAHLAVAAMQARTNSAGSHHRA